MKKAYIFLISVLIISFISAFTLSNEVITKIGCSTEEANNTISDNFIFGNLNVPFCNNVFKTIPVNERAAVVNQLFEYIKAYVNSDTFKEKYKIEHENMKPSEPKMEQIESLDDQAIQLQKVLEEQLNNPYLTPEQKEELKKNMETMKETTSSPEYKQQSAQLIEVQKKAAKEEYDIKIAEYKTELAEWEKLKDLNTMLKIRIQAFLDLTSNIDFNAKLVKVNNKMQFENPEYQEKSGYWKMCFRSGKETITTARECANRWLKEIK
ncbi:MAG: hypothetical protein HY951_08940 [Bacteroidia bacterium]|nr:hypothetical protein [Bacteroidia bacterium]